MEGVSTTLTASDLQGIAKAYDPAIHEAPITIGHPAHDAPAYGWVKSLSFADGALVADTEQSAELGELVSKGRYKKVSASFYMPTAPGNPTPGAWALRHVGFLGAQPPGIKGLKAVSFAELEEGVVTFGELPGYAGLDIARMFRSIREYFIADKGLEVADRVLPDWQINSLNEVSQRAQEPPAADPFTSFADPGKPIADTTVSQQEKSPTMKTAEQLQTELTASQLETKTLKDGEAKRLAESAHAGNVSFAEALVADAKWPAAAKDVLVATLDHLSRPADVVSFGEGDAAKPLAEVLRGQLQAMPAAVSFAEFAKKGSGGGESDTPATVATKAVAYQADQAAKGNRINTAEAVAHVSYAA